MSKVRILIACGRILGYSENKKTVKEFIDEYNIKDYRVEKIDKIPESIEDELAPKELFFDYHYNCTISEELLEYVTLIVNTLAENLLVLEETLRDFMEYVKLEPHESNLLFEMNHHIRDICSDTIGIDGDSPEGFYSDYFDLKEVIKRYLECE